MTYSEKKDQFCDRLLRRIIVFLVVAAFVIPLLTPRVFAASTVSISGGDQVKGGETFTVTVTYSGSQIGSVNGSMTYDTSKLNYLSGGSSNGNTGYIQLRENGSGSISFQIKFQAIGDGSTTLKVNTSEMYDINENALDNPSATKTVKVIGSADSKDVISETEASSAETVELPTEEGVDEKGDEGEMTGGFLFLIISAAVLVILIAVIATILIKKRNGRGKGPKNPKGPMGPTGLVSQTSPAAPMESTGMVSAPDRFETERREGLIDDRLNGGLDETQQNQYVEPEYADEWDPNPEPEPVSRDTRMFRKEDFDQEPSSWLDQEDRWPDDDEW